MSTLAVIGCCFGSFLLGIGSTVGVIAWFMGAGDRLPG